MIAKARADASANEIKGETEVTQARLQAEAEKIEVDTKIESLKKKHRAELDHNKAMAELDIKKTRELADIEAHKFKEIVDAIGKNTISTIARSGPETQAKLLQSLGLKGFMVMDGKNPVNLFKTANGMLGKNI